MEIVEHPDQAMDEQRASKSHLYNIQSDGARADKMKKYVENKKA